MTQSIEKKRFDEDGSYKFPMLIGDVIRVKVYPEPANKDAPSTITVNGCGEPGTLSMQHTNYSDAQNKNPVCAFIKHSRFFH